jgi:CRP-like cAMP-binding protein
MAELLTPIRLLSHRLSGGVSLERDEIDALRAIAGPARKFSRGDLLVAQGEKANHVWLTGDGWAFRQKLLSDGRRQIIALMLPGELSEKGPMMPFGSPDMIVAATALTAQSIARRDLMGVVEAHPRILQALFYEELTRHAITREWVLLLGQRTATERLAYLIYETFARLKAMGMVSDNHFEFPVPQPDLADIVGMSTVHLNRTLQRLRRQNLVNWSGTRVELPDPAALAAHAQFDKGFQEMARQFSERAAHIKAERLAAEQRAH